MRDWVNGDPTVGGSGAVGDRPQRQYVANADYRVTGTSTSRTRAEHDREHEDILNSDRGLLCEVAGGVDCEWYIES